MFLAHWAATEPRETVVSSVRSESGSADRRSMTRQNRTTARSAPRRFTASAEGVGEVVLLGTEEDATAPGEGFGLESDSVQPASKATMHTVRPHLTNRPNRVFNTHLPPVLTTQRGLLDRGGQAPTGCWRTLIASRLTQPSRGDLWITGRSLTQVPCQEEPPKRNRCGWSGLLAYIVHAARGNVPRSANSAACPR
jgi:hypothetical protein